MTEKKPQTAQERYNEARLELLDWGKEAGHSGVVDYIVGAADTLITEQEARIAQLEAALQPFALNEGEDYDTQAFEDDDFIYLRPDDGNDSVKNGWRKDVTFADVRRATRLLE